MTTKAIGLVCVLLAQFYVLDEHHLSAQGRVQSNTLAEIAILEDERAIDTTKVSQWVNNPDPEVRARTAYMIGIVGDTAYKPFLAKLLTEESRAVLLPAIFAAGQLADTTFTDRLIRYSADGDSSIKAHAIDALSKAASPAAIKQLIAILSDTLEKPQVRAAVAESMHRLTDRLSFGSLVAQASNPIAIIRERVFYSLARRANREGLPFYVSGLKDEVRQIRIFSLNALARVGDASVIPEIKPLLQENDWRVKYYALTAAGKLKAQALSREVAALSGGKEHPYVRQAAIRALGDLGDPQASDRLSMLLAEADYNLSAEALLAFAKLKKDSALSQIRDFATSESSYLRVAAAGACQYVESPERRNILETLSKDAAATVRTAAFEELFEENSDTMWTTFVLRALADSDFVPATLACNLVSSRRHFRSLSMVYRIYKFTNSVEVKAAVLDCFIDFGDSLPRDLHYIGMANWALEDKDYTIRQRGAKLAAALGSPVERPNDHYKSEITPENYGQVYSTRGANPLAEIKTVKGTIRIELLRSAAPKTVANFVKLAKSGFYDKRVWHRVVPDFVIQDGCPRGDGWGGPGYEIRCEYNDLSYNTGSVGMATSGKDTGGSQFFICQSPQPHLNGRYTLFGRLLEGMDVVDSIEVGDRIQTVKIIEPKE